MPDIDFVGLCLLLCIRTKRIPISGKQSVVKTKSQTFLLDTNKTQLDIMEPLESVVRVRNSLAIRFGIRSLTPLHSIA